MLAELSATLLTKSVEYQSVDQVKLDRSPGSNPPKPKPQILNPKPQTLNPKRQPPNGKQVLWLKSRNSEDWLQRRTNYTRSLALMSIVGYIRFILCTTHSHVHRRLQCLRSYPRVGHETAFLLFFFAGYILGLGDRHPSNLMLHRYSGKLVHVDFGDCFEVPTPKP